MNRDKVVVNKKHAQKFSTIKKTGPERIANDYNNGELTKDEAVKQLMAYILDITANLQP